MTKEQEEVELRDYQEVLIGEARGALSKHKRVLIQAPTGAGKTVLASFIMKNVAQRRQRGFFICHRRELIDQTSATFTKFGVEHSFIASGYPHDATQLVQICSIDTLKNRVKPGHQFPHHTLMSPNLIIWDEAHHMAAGGWARVHERFSDIYHVGLSATPERLDGKGLRPWFDLMVQGPTVRQLIDTGQLAPYSVWSQPLVDVSRARLKFGEYARPDIERAIQESTILGDSVTHWLKHAKGRKTIAFAPSVSASIRMVNEFENAGISSAHLDGATNRYERRTVLERFALGEIDVLWNVNLFGEGFDVAANSGHDVVVEAVIDLAPTKSLGRWLQRCGRALRPQERAVILDHAGNALRHGLPCDARDWSLDSKARSKRNEDGPSIRVCQSCYFAFNPSVDDTCPNCGWSPRETSEFAERSGPGYVDGELAELKPGAKIAKPSSKKTEQGKARTLDELIHLGKMRGYHRPRAWAEKIMAARQRKHGFSRKSYY